MTVLLVEQKLPFARWVAHRFCIVDKGPGSSGRGDSGTGRRSGAALSDSVNLPAYPGTAALIRQTLN